MNSLRTLLWLAIAICCTAAGLSAQPTFQMSPSTVSVDAGKTFSLDLVVQNFGSVKAFSFPVKWDPAVLQLESVSNPYASLTNFDPSEGMASGSISQGILVVIWQHPSLQTVNVPNGTSLFKLNFKAKIAGSSAVTVNRTTSFVEIINANDADIAANAVFQPASVTVKSTTDDSVVNPNDPIVIDLGAVSGPTGNTVCVPVKVSKFKRMENFQFSIHYDPALLEFAHVKNYNLADLDTASFSLPTNPNLGPGTLIVGWNNNSGASNGVSVVDGTTIFELCFLLKGPGGSNTNITINGNPLKIEVTRKDQPGVNVGLTPTGGLATITGNSGALEKVTLTAGSATGLPGADICVDIKVKGLSNTKSLGLSISWTAGVLTYKGVSGFGLTGLDASDFSVSGNKLTVNWSAAQGQTLADGSTLFRLCFTGSGTAGQQSPLTISDGTATNGSGQAQQFVGADGNISITSVNSGEFALIGGNVSVLEGDEVCVPVSVNGFKNILTMQFDMAYDQNMLEFVGFRNLSLAGLTEEKFGKPGEGRVAMGQITFAWIDDSAKGVTLPDGTVIFEVCFRTKGAAGSQTMFQFDETFAEVADAGSKVLPFKGLDGMVNIISNSIPDFTLSGVNQTVASGNQVCLPVKANGFTGLKKLSFEMNYDATLLEWVGVQNIAVTGATVANFDVSVAGTIKFTWQSGDNGGLTLPNATNLFEICLKAKGSSTVTTTFQFKDTGATVEDEEGTALGFRNTDASITIQGLLAPDEFGLVTSGADVKQGESICLPVRVNGFTKIVALQFSMQFDPAILAFDTLMNSRFADLIYGKPGAGGVGANEISILWDDDRQTGVTLSNGETLFEICFKVIGNPGSLTNVGYYDNGAEIVNANSNVLPFKGLAGSVNIVSDVQNLAIASGEVTDAACFNGRNGSVNITLQGGQAPYTFRWSNDAVTEDLVGVPAGNYTVTVTDSRGGAGIVQSFEVKQPAAIAIAETLTNVACFGADSGTIQLQVSGGTGAYQFNWSGAAGTGSQATGLKAGTYRVTVTDANACTIRDTFMLTENPALRVNSSIVPINNNKAGSIEITANGGNGAYGYQWSGPENFVSTQEDLTNLSKEGNYSVTVTDGLGCTFTSTIELPKNTQALAATVLRGEEARCNGEASGKAVINIAGGCAPYTISAGEQSATDADGAEAILDGLAAGTYEITVQDDCGATFSAGSVTIQQPTPLQYTTAITSDLLDAGCTGVIRVSGSGGTGTLSYQWNNNRNGAELNNLCAGDYRMTVTDSRGCQLASQLITVTPFGVVKADSKITDTNCPADPSGKIMPAVTGGQAPLQYEWLDAGGNKVGDTKDLSKVLAGIYTLRITEASGQLVEQSFTIGSMSSLSAEVAVLTNFNGFGVSCPGNKDGRLEAKVRSGTGTYEYRWSNGASGAMLDQVAPGMYTVSITDAFGCMVKVDTELSAPAAITGTITTDPVSCSGDADGEARVADLAGGVGAYTVNWGDQTGMVAMNLAAGTYTATVTDGNGCRQTLQGTVAAPAPLEITFATESDKGAQDGSATALAAGGSAPYQFEWNTGAATSRLNQLKYGEYKVRVTDANGCEAEAVTTISAAFDCLSMRKVITPDGDGFNENFVINCLELFPDNKLEVFNRWGQMVFEHKNYDNSWEGTDSRGSDLPAGGYFFVFKYTDPNNGESLQEKGGVTIIRE